MKRLLVVGCWLLVCMGCLAQRTTQPGVRISGTHTSGNVVVFGDSGRTLVDGGVAPTNLVVVSNQLSVAQGDARYVQHDGTNAIIAAVKDAVATVTHPDGTRVLYGSIYTAAWAVTNGCSFDILQSETIEDNILIKGNDVVVNGHGNTLTVVMDDLGSQPAYVDSNIAVGQQGTNTVMRGLNIRAQFSSTFPTNYYPYGLVYMSNRSSGALVDDCNIQLEMDNWGGPAEAPKAFVQATGTSRLLVKNTTISYFDTDRSEDRGFLFANHTRASGDVAQYVDCTFICQTNLISIEASQNPDPFELINCRINIAEWQTFGEERMGGLVEDEAWTRILGDSPTTLLPAGESTVTTPTRQYLSDADLGSAAYSSTNDFARAARSSLITGGGYAMNGASLTHSANLGQVFNLPSGNFNAVCWPLIAVSQTSETATVNYKLTLASPVADTNKYVQLLITSTGWDTNGSGDTFSILGTTTYTNLQASASAANGNIVECAGTFAVPTDASRYKARQAMVMRKLADTTAPASSNTWRIIEFNVWE